MVTGGSSGIGKATVRALMAEGVSVTAVARDPLRLRALESELDGVRTVSCDAAAPDTAERLLRELRPDLVVLAAGVTPDVRPFDAFDWEAFSAAWNVDLQASFRFLQAAIAVPLAPGSTLAVVSSGAALHGSPLSGGYAGAKRMQWWLADYAQKVSDARGLGLRVVTVVPDQLVAGTTIGERAAAAYGALSGITAEAFMARYDAPLYVDGVAAAIVAALRGDAHDGARALAVRGSGTRSLP